MLTSYICLRCRQKLLQRCQFLRGFGFVSLSQTIGQTDNNPPPERKPLLLRRQHGRKANNASKKNAGNSRAARADVLTAKAGRSSSGMDSVLEKLFSSQRDKQLGDIQTSHSEVPINHTDQSVNLVNAPSQTKGAIERPRDPPFAANRSEQIIAKLWQQEKRIAESISDIELLLGDTAVSHSDEGATPSGNPKDQPKGLGYNDKARRITTIIKYIERAVHRYDVAQVGVQWQKYQQTLAHLELDEQSREAIYTHFLTAYFTLSRQEQAVNVWNHMLEAEITPNERHWNAMLKGCFKAQDVKSLQEVWSNMLASGTRPDLGLWTTYIHGLIMCGKWQRGLQVLDELGAKWKAASKTPMPIAKNLTQDQWFNTADYDPYRPSLAPIQAALTALTAIQRHELCYPLLDWAKSYSLNLTTEIFNILLRPAVRAGSTAQIVRIFSLMNVNHCSADEVTYTILLNGHMSNTNSSFAILSPQEQRDSILRILDDMTANNISIERRTYSTILQGLLSPANETSNDNAAEAVLQHMAQNNVTPDSYMYHMLVTHHFSRDPPALAAIENIWARIKIERPSLQSIFYEKMVEGYAKARSVEKMMFFVRRFAREGKSPRWRCLVDVLITLIEEGEWGFVRELVEDVKDSREGLMRYADENIVSRAREEFWDIVEGVKGRIEEVEQSPSAL